MLQIYLEIFTKYDSILLWYTVITITAILLFMLRKIYNYDEYIDVLFIFQYNEFNISTVWGDSLNVK